MTYVIEIKFRDLKLAREFENSINEEYGKNTIERDYDKVIFKTERTHDVEWFESILRIIMLRPKYAYIDKEINRLTI